MESYYAEEDFIPLAENAAGDAASRRVGRSRLRSLSKDTNCGFQNMTGESETCAF